MLRSKPHYKFNITDIRLNQVYLLYKDRLREEYKKNFLKEDRNGFAEDYRYIQAHQMIMFYPIAKMNGIKIDDEIISNCLSCLSIDWYKILKIFGYYNELGEKTSGVVERLPRNKKIKGFIDEDMDSFLKDVKLKKCNNHICCHGSKR